MLDKIKFMFDAAKVAASRSNYPGTHVGCIIAVDREKGEESGSYVAGFNRKSNSVDYDSWIAMPRRERLVYTVHAESDAMLSHKKVYSNVRNCLTVDEVSVYIYGLPPCSACCEVLSELRDMHKNAIITVRISYPKNLAREWKRSWHNGKKTLADARMAIIECETD